jgi:two-component system sensor histidine kinase DesK
MEPAFHLIYLVFLFFPMLFSAPATIDIVVSLIAVVVFIPIHFYAYRASSRDRLLPIALVAVIGAVLAFFDTGNGVFHVYCAAMAGFIRPVWRSGAVLALCALVYVTAGLVAGRTGIEMGFILFMSLIIWFGCMSDAQTMLDKAQQEREHELDTQAASLLERERIGRDLHDLLGHTLTMVALKSDLANRLIDSNPEQAKVQVQEIQEGARRALNDVRVALSGLAAVSVVTELANAHKALSSAGVELTVTGALPDLSLEQDKVCGLMIREAVTNIIRHTRASRAHIQFTNGNGVKHVTVSDNGGGSVGAEGRGLNGLRRRIESLGGSVLINNDNGVSLRASLPVAAA